MERAQLQETESDSSTDSAPAGASDTKMSWQQQKEEQARRRKLENALKKIETQIETLEKKNEELDAALTDPANGTDIALLQSLSKEKEENDTQLMELMEQWEELSE